MKAFFYFLLISGVAQASPDWAKQNTLKRDGDVLTLACQSDASPSLAIARKSAISSCEDAASDFVTSNYTISSTTIETNRESAIHSEIQKNIQVSGLNCKPIREENEQIDGSFIDYLECSFNLSTAKITNSPNPNEAALTSKREGGIKNKASLSVLPPLPPLKENSVNTGGQRQVVLNSIPPCSEVLIRGERPRVVKCVHNPQSIVLDESDRELIVQSNGFLPKHLEISSGSNSLNSIEVITVDLERE